MAQLRVQRARTLPQQTGCYSKQWLDTSIWSNAEHPDHGTPVGFWRGKIRHDVPAVLPEMATDILTGPVPAKISWAQELQHVQAKTGIQWFHLADRAAHRTLVAYAEHLYQQVRVRAVFLVCDDEHGTEIFIPSRKSTVRKLYVQHERDLGDFDITRTLIPGFRFFPVRNFANLHLVENNFLGHIRLCTTQTVEQQAEEGFENDELDAKDSILLGGDVSILAGAEQGLTYIVDGFEILFSDISDIFRLGIYLVVLGPAFVLVKSAADDLGDTIGAARLDEWPVGAEWSPSRKTVMMHLLPEHTELAPPHTAGLC